MANKKRIPFAAAADHHQFLEGPAIAGHVVQYSERQRLLLIDGKPVDCTPTEYPLLMCMLQQSERSVPLASLAQCAFHSALDSSTRHCLTQHIGRMRRKLRPFGIGIHCVRGDGYLLQPEPADTGDREQTADMPVAATATG